ncbi:hypothetical protein DFQ01_13081 [Paenibacillus cellulosilyticus]|uniref:Uncharacterized protein n=1 Tax=Paenibacillus cellulosilyticus TaxID=375489 RepID=A0A2V2YLR5_9BACL|nr:hypothetical protein [Paenibacillus cellulosilyticus]PWV94516.1 hypothetical protein DFQ01_13081 [Paenibacillus cellulosilyticus]QKS45024.1 hypothetical protein HUB94_11820 [Paenibacillus cellulosilyticus]
MPYFERSNRMYKVFFTLSSLSLLITVIAYSLSDLQEIIQYNIVNSNHFLWTLWTVVFFVLSIFFLILGIVLRKVAQDAEDDMSSMARQIKELREALEGGSAARKKSYSDTDQH